MKKKDFFRERKSKLILFSLLVPFILTNSCTQERLLETAKESAIASKTLMYASADIGVNNGRLYFPNKEMLQETYEKLNEGEDDENVANFIEKYGITSLRPVVTESNEQNIYDQTLKRIEKLKENKRFMSTKDGRRRIENTEAMISDIDDLEALIGDDVFSALLNSDGEIQIGSDIYKYTDTGIFIVDQKNYDALGKLLEKENISDNLLYQTEASIASRYISSRPTQMVYAISPDEGIGYYPGNIPPQTIPSGGAPSYTPPNNNPPAVNTFLNNLNYCKIGQGTFSFWPFKGLFGDNNVCIDKYESRRRVKTKAYNYNYFVVYHLGAKVKHQYRGWTGFWRKEKADEIRLGIEGVQFQYDFSSFFAGSSSYDRGATSIYVQNNRYQYDASTFWNNGWNGIYTMTGFSTQGFPRVMKDDIIIENFGEGTTADIVGPALSQANRQMTSDKLNQLFWQSTITNLKNFWTKIGQSAPAATDNKVTLFRKYPEFGKVLIHKTYFESGNNISFARKTFDFGAQLSISINPNSGKIDNVSPSTTIKKPQDFMVKMYGIAKKNGQWHGSKMDNTR